MKFLLTGVVLAVMALIGIVLNFRTGAPMSSSSVPIVGVFGNKPLEGFGSTVGKQTPAPTIIPHLTTDRVFSGDHTWTSQLPKDETWTLIATGDIIPARSVNWKTTGYGDYLWAWNDIIPVLSAGDITFANLESPLVKNCPVTTEGMVFCGDERHMEGIKAAGIDIINLANNHAGNYGVEGLANTKRLMDDAGVAVTGMGVPVIREIRGIRVAFLGFNDISGGIQGIAAAKNDEVKRAIELVRPQADLVVVTFHYGVEYRSVPDDRQKELSRLAVDAGADLVIGNHPHWIQGIELYKDKYIAYAHGNTIFDQMWSEETKKGVIGRYTFMGTKLVDAEYIPLYIEDYGKPKILEGTAKAEVLSGMKASSEQLLSQ